MVHKHILVIYPPTLPSNCCGRAAPGTTVGVELCSLASASMNFRTTVGMELCSLASASMNVTYQCYGHLLVLIPDH